MKRMPESWRLTCKHLVALQVCISTSQHLPACNIVFVVIDACKHIIAQQHRLIATAACLNTCLHAVLCLLSMKLVSIVWHSITGSLLLQHGTAEQQALFCKEVLRETNTMADFGTNLLQTPLVHCFTMPIFSKLL